MAMGEIVVRGARVHNLRDVDIDIPRGKLVVITGPSGSGKSSLAFDTIYAEGQRRYVESLSAHARLFLEQMPRPDCDIIEGLSPALAIAQQGGARNPRSTVGTTTEVHDYLRLLYARAGQVRCYGCGRRIAASSVQEIVDQALGLSPGTRFIVAAPVLRGARGDLSKELEDLRRAGYIRVAIDGVVHDLSTGLAALDAEAAHDVDVHVDRLVAKDAGPGRDSMARRLADSVELALGLADGRVTIEPVGEAPMHFSQRFACMECGISYPAIEPRMFSFNNPHGACPACDGLGWRLFFDPDLVVPAPGKSIREGAIAPWPKPAQQRALAAACRALGIDMDSPWRSLPAAGREALLRGPGASGAAGAAGAAGSGKAAGDKAARGKAGRGKQPFAGVIPALAQRLAEAERGGSDDADAIIDELREYMSETRCEVCMGTRLRIEARHVTVGERSIAEVGAMPLDQALAFFRGLDLAGRERAVADRLLREITSRLAFLVSVGLDYLSLDRRATTLSGGEAQRIRLATQLGAALVGVLYVLDEPSIGLHPRDTGRLLDALVRLRDLGNTVLVVEHDEDTMRSADYLIDMGPGAGIEGGRVVAAGTPAEVMADVGSLTGQYLAGARVIEVPPRRRRGRGELVIEGARTNNLEQVTVGFPLGVRTCVTGVSGSGKSSLVIDTLRPALAAHLAGRMPRPGTAGDFDALRGAEQVDRVIYVDQSPIGRTPRSNPASYAGVFALIRERFAALPESRARGYKAGRYSFNVKGGRCEVCQGAGVARIDMSFLPDVFVVCDICGGKRYSRETLDIRYKGCDIAQALDMSVEQAIDFWASVPQIRLRLEAMRDVGLGYLTLGQPASTLSGGEAQRLKLARELAKKATGRTLYILDEPTTGLHFEDVRRLLHVLDLLVEQGNTVIVIEHEMDVIKTSDHVIDMGPEGGRAGGRILGTGTPEDIAAVEGSHTGRILRRLL